MPLYALSEPLFTLLESCQQVVGRLLSCLFARTVIDVDIICYPHRANRGPQELYITALRADGLEAEVRYVRLQQRRCPHSQARSLHQHVAQHPNPEAEELRTAISSVTSLLNALFPAFVSVLSATSILLMFGSIELICLLKTRQNEVIYTIHYFLAASPGYQ